MGSEMCIRDSSYLGSGDRSHTGRGSRGAVVKRLGRKSRDLWHFRALLRESLHKLTSRQPSRDVSPFYWSNIVRVFVALNLSGVGLKQPTGKGIISTRKTVLDVRFCIDGLGMGMQRGMRPQTRFRLTRVQSGSVELS